MYYKCKKPISWLYLLYIESYVLFIPTLQTVQLFYNFIAVYKYSNKIRMIFYKNLCFFSHLNINKTTWTEIIV